MTQCMGFRDSTLLSSSMDTSTGFSFELFFLRHKVEILKPTQVVVKININ